MKIVETTDANGSLAEYAAGISAGPIVVTSQGKPVAALVSIENADLETVSLSTNPQFIELIERSRASIRNGGTLSSEEMKKKFS
jgi:prevent-host-death family protein